MTITDQFGNYEPHLVSEATMYTLSFSTISGSGPPDNGLGNDGQLYVDTDDGTLYSKGGGVWTTSVAAAASGKITSGYGSPVGVVDPSKFVIYVQLDSDPRFLQWNSDGIQWVES